jgi:hypothetical protein
MNDQKKRPQGAFTEVFKTFNPGDVAFVKSLLEEKGLIYYVNNENVTMVGGLAFAEPMRVMVESDKAEDVKNMLAEFQGNFGAFAFEEELQEDEEGEEPLAGQEQEQEPGE